MLRVAMVTSTQIGRCERTEPPHIAGRDLQSPVEMNDEFDNFMERVTEVERLVREMQSSDERVSERARLKATLLIGPDHLEPLEDGAVRCKRDRTVINQRAFDRIGKADDPSEMSKEAFMAQVERDADMRAKDRKQRKQRSDELRRKANEAFRQKNFEIALDLYNKAIDETRDSAVLYENRALTYLNLELYFKTVDDCDWALRLDNNSLKALLYKAKALHYLQNEEKSVECINKAEKKFPQHQNLISEYIAMWLQPGECQKSE